MALFACAGLLAVLGTVAVMKTRPAAFTARETDPGYDLVFKYCTARFVRDERKLSPLRTSPLFPQVAALPAGVYETENGGTIYVMGLGMFRVILPSSLQVVRRFGEGMTVSGDPDGGRPRSVIGCTPEHLARVMDVYGLEIKKPESRPSTGQRSPG